MISKTKKLKPQEPYKRRVCFGTSAVRFGQFTQHPQLDRHGLFSERPAGCDPSLYSPNYHNTICKLNNQAKDVWQYKIDLEEWAANLGYRNPTVLQAREWQKSLLGPAWYDPKDLPKINSSVCPNVGFGRSRRFQVNKTMYTPPPGAYYHEVPYKIPYGSHSKRPTFMREEPCRFKETKLFSLAPNRYVIKDPDSISEKPNKIISLRGPYDLTSGERIMVHKEICSTTTWPLALTGSFETYKKSHLGVMNKSGFDNHFRGRNALVDIALCSKKPSDPGPADQNIVKPSVFKQCRYGFNSSDDKPVGYIRPRVWPVVGRYSIGSKKEQNYIPGKGHTSLFKSKVQRTIGAILPKPMNTF